MTQARQQTGRIGELVAADYLRDRGYTVIDRNARLGRGELDIVASAPRTRRSRPGPPITGDRVLVFVEVKTARAGRFAGPVSPTHAVDPRKCAQVRRLGRRWLAENPGGGWAEVRFDVIGVTLGGAEPEVEHIEAAF